MKMKYFRLNLLFLRAAIQKLIGISGLSVNNQDNLNVDKKRIELYPKLFIHLCT